LIKAALKDIEIENYDFKKALEKDKMIEYTT
jgi:hypothetical protein